MLRHPTCGLSSASSEEETAEECRKPADEQAHTKKDRRQSHRPHVRRIRQENLEGTGKPQRHQPERPGYHRKPRKPLNEFHQPPPRRTAAIVHVGVHDQRISRLNESIGTLLALVDHIPAPGARKILGGILRIPTHSRPGHSTLEGLERALGEEVEVSKAILEKLPEGAVVRSPGMKYKHYAPKADVTLLNGTFAQFKAYVDAHKDENPSCLCFTGESAKLDVPCVEYGREGDGADQAKHIFRSLRALDEQGDGVVYARCPQKDGLSMAVYNRLIRAAAFRVIDL